MQEALLDTDILNEVLKQKDAHVIQKASEYLKQHQQFAFSSMTWYEVLRGLKFKKATRQLANFTTFCNHSIIYPVSDAILERTADLWVEGENGGHPYRDADLIIAALFTNIEDAFAQYRRGVLTDEDWQKWKVLIRQYMAQPGVRMNWSRTAESFNPSFRKYVESLGSHEIYSYTFGEQPAAQHADEDVD